MIDKDGLQLDKPRRTPDHPTKSHVVKTRVDGKEKIIRFGEQGASTAGKPKQGESERMTAKRASFKSRHAKNIAKGKSSAAYWADRVKWATGGSVELEDLNSKYEGLKKPDFSLLNSFKGMIKTLQSRAEETQGQEFDPLETLKPTRAAPTLEDLYASYGVEPTAGPASVAGIAGHAGRVEAGVTPPDALSLAASQMGLTEGGQRAAIQDYLTTGGANLDPATTAWCAAFVNSTLQQTGVQGTGSNMARSFLDWGQSVDQPQEGDLAVFSRGDPNGPYGHVGFFKGYDDQGNVLVLGGNQGDAVSIASYPRESLLGFRRAGEAEPQKFAKGGLAELTQKYDRGGEVPKPERGEPETSSLTGFPEIDRMIVALGNVNQMFNPVEAIGESMDASKRMLAPDTPAMDRVAALGDMLSGVGGVVAPVATAARAGTPAAAALMESLLGGSPATTAMGDTAKDVGRAIVERANQRGPVPMMGSNFGNVPVKPPKATKGFRAYHSSPYDFDEFDISKTGTGYGTGFYGNGLYFSKDRRVSGQGGEYWREFLDRFEGPEREAAEVMLANKFDREKAAEQMQRRIKNSEYSGLEEIVNTQKAALDMIRSGQIVGPRTYEVDIKANPNDFFDFDRRLGEQSPAVREAFSSIGTPEELADLYGYQAYDKLQELHGYTPNRLPDLNAEREAGIKSSAVLRDAGVPGTRAEDGRSTHYAVFDDKLISLVRKYGIAGAATMLGVSSADVEQAVAQPGVEDLNNKYAEGGGVSKPNRGEIMYAVPPPAESWGKGSSPKRERNFGELALEMADPYIAEAYDALTRAPVIDTNSYVPQSVQRINQAIGNTGSAALSALTGLVYGGAGLAGDVADATGLGGGSRLARDLAAMSDVAGVAPEGRMLSALLDAGAARDAGRTIVERANQRGPVPVMGSNFGNVFKPVTPEIEAADRVAEMLRMGREDEITDELLEQADPQVLMHHYKSGNTGMDMPMDYASRMARAKEQGFRGDLYSGTGEDFAAFDRNAVYATDNPDLAYTYAPTQGGSIMPLMMRTKYDLPMIEAGGSNWNMLTPEMRKGGPGAPFLPKDELPPASFENEVENYNPDNWDFLTTRDFEEAAKKQGLSGVTFNNIVDMGGYFNKPKGDPGTPEREAYMEYIMNAQKPSAVEARFYPNLVRSKFARFDPRLSHLGNLSAGVAAGAVGLEAAQYDPDQVDKIADTVRKREFATGGAVKYDPAAVDSIINQIREVNRG
jgi:uncharacterized protein (TIGR02594 family)